MANERTHHPGISELVREAKAEGKSYRGLAATVDNVVAHQTFQKWENRTHTEFPTVRSIKAIAEALSITEQAVVLGIASDLGIETRPESLISAQLPVAAEELTADQRRAIVLLVRSMNPPGHVRRL